MPDKQSKDKKISPPIPDTDIAGRRVRVGIGAFNVVRPPVVLTTTLGSCIGIALYDPEARIAGLSHIMLPCRAGRFEDNPGKFVDSAIPLLIHRMIIKGACRDRLIAKIAGGAKMFSFKEDNDYSDVGRHNGEAVRRQLEHENIPIVAEDTGGDKGRTVEFFTTTGEFHVRIFDAAVRVL
jgi:chemotaxis protein CheD